MKKCELWSGWNIWAWFTFWPLFQLAPPQQAVRLHVYLIESAQSSYFCSVCLQKEEVGSHAVFTFVMFLKTSGCHQCAQEQDVMSHELNDKEEIRTRSRARLSAPFLLHQLSICDMFIMLKITLNWPSDPRAHHNIWTYQKHHSWVSER